MAIKIINTSDNDFGSKVRTNIFRFLVIFFFLAITVRLIQLQIIEGTIYRSETDAQAFKEELIDPYRGRIFGRDGQILVDNDPSFTVRITPNDFRKESIPLLAHILEIDTTEIIKELKKLKGYIKFHPIKIFKDIDYRKVALMEEYNDLLPGVDVTIETKRKYYFTSRMAHLIGYVSEASQRTLRRKSYYKPGDMVGNTGIESAYEDLLRGVKGKRFIAVNRSGTKVAGFANSKIEEYPKNGNDLYITIDLRLQKKAEQLMRYRRGAIVAMDPNNGEVLAIVSKPDYNIRRFHEDYGKLLNNRYKPLINRAVNTPYPPGSTWKMLTAMAALQEGIITPNTKIQCTGSFQYRGKGKVFDCHGAHGYINVRKAIQYSCNVFFYNVGPELGLEKLHKYGTMFGFGKKTGIDIPNEIGGLLPSVEYVKQRFGAGVSTKGRMVIYAIGQGEILVTPIQMAAYVSTIANKGTYYQPHVVKAIYNPKEDRIQPVSFKKRKIPIDEKIFDVVRDGMYDVVNKAGGTADNISIPKLAVCGKTGTAQTRGRDHSWFVCFAPKDNPKIAVVVIAENAGYGADVAAPIAKDLLQYYFFPNRSNIAKKRIAATPDDEKDQTTKEKPDAVPHANQ